LTDWFSNDDLFRSELEAGHLWATYVADQLRESGIDAVLTPLEWRDDIDDRHRFADERDIEVGTSAGPVTIEAKSRRLPFSSDPATYPYDTALVDTVSGWERKSVEPKAVVLVSRQSRAMLVIPVRTTRSKWTIKSTRDRVRGIDDDWYQCPRNLLVPFASLVSWLQRISTRQ
jgi:hypothetical protein